MAGRLYFQPSSGVADNSDDRGVGTGPAGLAIAGPIISFLLLLALCMSVRRERPVARAAQMQRARSMQIICARRLARAVCICTCTKVEVHRLT